MGLKALRQKLVFLDSAPLIYFIESSSPFQSQLKAFFEAVDNENQPVVTSTLTLLEVLVQPIKLNRLDLVQKYKEILTLAPGIEIAELTAAIAHKAANVRAAHGIKTPDSIQVATAIETGAKYFLTNDYRMKSVKEIEAITPADL